MFQQDALLPGGATYTSTLDTEVAGAAPSTPAGSLTTLRWAVTLGTPAIILLLGAGVSILRRG